MNKIICKLLGQFVWMVCTELIPIYAICAMVSNSHNNGILLNLGCLVAVLWIFGGIYDSMKCIHKTFAEYKKLKETEKE